MFNNNKLNLFQQTRACVYRKCWNKKRIWIFHNFQKENTYKFCLLHILLFWKRFISSTYESSQASSFKLTIYYIKFCVWHNFHFVSYLKSLNIYDIHIEREKEKTTQQNPNIINELPFNPPNKRRLNCNIKSIYRIGIPSLHGPVPLKVDHKFLRLKIPFMCVRRMQRSDETHWENEPSIRPTILDKFFYYSFRTRLVLKYK